VSIHSVSTVTVTPWVEGSGSAVRGCHPLPTSLILPYSGVGIHLKQGSGRVIWITHFRRSTAVSAPPAAASPGGVRHGSRPAGGGSPRSVGQSPPVPGFRRGCQAREATAKRPGLAAPPGSG